MWPFSKKDKEKISVSQYPLINFRVVVVEFVDNIRHDYGEKIVKYLNSQEGINASYFNEPFSKDFLNFDGRTLFDLIDKGQDIIEKTGANVLVWGYREGNKIRLNFQADRQYETEAFAFLSLLDSLYIPDDLESAGDLIYGAVISAVKAFTFETKVQKKFLLKKIINRLSNNNSAKNFPVDYMPYVMNFLGAIYLSYSFDSSDSKDFKITKELLENAIKHKDLITNPIHLGCIYNHIGQLYDNAASSMEKKSLNYFKGAITFYQQAQKYLSKYNYPYDYGYISFKLSKLFFNYWKQKNDLQALRDAVFQLREAEKVYTQVLFPEFWAEIEESLGYMLSLLGSITKSEDISELAIAAYKNQQKIITEKRDALHWAKIQEKIGEIYYRLGKNSSDQALLEEALEYYHDALYVFENMNLTSELKTLTTNITKTSQILNELNED